MLQLDIFIFQILPRKVRQEQLPKSKSSIKTPTTGFKLSSLLEIRKGGGKIFKMSRALLSSCAMCSLARMAPRSLSALASLQHGPYYFVLGKTMWPMPLIKELPSMLRGTATIRPIATSAIRRSDEEKGSTIDNTAMHGQLQHQAASEVNMKKA